MAVKPDDVLRRVQLLSDQDLLDLIDSLIAEAYHQRKWDYQDGEWVALPRTTPLAPWPTR